MCAGRGLRSCTLMFTLRNVPWPQSASVPFGSGPGGQRTVQAVRIHEGKFAGAVPPGSSVLVRKRSGWRGPQSWLSHGSRGRWGRSSNLSWAGAAVVAIGVGCVLACEKLRAALPRRRGTLGCPAAPGAATPDLATMPGGAGSERIESVSAYYCTCIDTPKFSKYVPSFGDDSGSWIVPQLAEYRNSAVTCIFFSFRASPAGTRLEAATRASGALYRLESAHELEDVDETLVADRRARSRAR